MERVPLATFSFLAAALLLLPPPFITTVYVAAATAGNGSSCTTRCGNISFEYPFGVEAGCYHAGFGLTCNESHNPPMLFLGDGHSMQQVLDISIPTGTVRINSSVMVFDTNHANAVRKWEVGGQGRRRSPYVLSDQNMIALVGCNSQVDIRGGEDKTLISSCTAACPDSVVGEGDLARLACSGVGCCQANIVISNYSYSIQIHKLQGQGVETTFRKEDIVYIVDQPFNYTEDMVPGAITAPKALPALLDWFINTGNSSSCLPPTDTSAYGSASECRSAHSFCQTYADSGYQCYCSEGYEGNPYVYDGCHDIDECNYPYPDIYPCYGDCKNTEGGYECRCHHGYIGNASILNGCKDVNECEKPEAYSCYGVCTNMPGTFNCNCPAGTYGSSSTKGGCMALPNHSSKVFSGLNIGLIVSSGSILLLLGLAAPFIVRKVMLERVKKVRDKFFTQNHGLLLQQLISRNTDFDERMIITLEELEKATNNFDKTREVGDGGHGVVYKGILDLHVVAIKKSKIIVQREIDEFINEVAILSQVNHKNVVKLLGCCLETEVPLLVYEFISNGTLYCHLHVEGQVSLPWDDRLRIALEVARALSYLHPAASMPIFHRDIKSSNILLDDNLIAKVSDFGASRYISINQTGITTAVQGTIGYLDPMYYYTGRLTSKSDVFSFGVLLIELLTRKKPICDIFENGDSLVSHFASLLSKGQLYNIIDPQVLEEEDGEILEIAMLATTCTKFKGEERPSMREVEMALENIVTKKDPIHNGNTAAIRPDKSQILPLYMSIEGVTKEASSRQYTTEEDMLLSSSYPR